jgi:hypothetical protein
MRKLAAKRKPRKKLLRRVKKAGQVAKKGAVPAASLGAGYLGGRMGSSNVADKAKSKGFSEAELKEARKRIYGY